MQRLDSLRSNGKECGGAVAHLSAFHEFTRMRVRPVARFPRVETTDLQLSESWSDIGGWILDDFLPNARQPLKPKGQFVTVTATVPSGRVVLVPLSNECVPFVLKSA